MPRKKDKDEAAEKGAGVQSESMDDDSWSIIRCSGNVCNCQSS